MYYVVIFRSYAKKFFSRSLIIYDKMPFRVDTCTFKKEERDRKRLCRFVCMSLMVAEISLRFFTFIVSLWCFSLSSFLFPELTSIP